MTAFAPCRAAAGLALGAGLALLAGCSGAAPETGSTPSVRPTGRTAPAPVVTPTVGSTPRAAPACDTIIPGDLVDDFAKSGWTSEKDVFRIGETEVPGGILCTWGDPEMASDNVQMFGWAPISGDDAALQETALLAQGWIREEDADGVYITEDPKTAVSTDDDGYGWTYLFGDGWVKVADTKQSLVLVDWPPSG